MFNYSTGPVRPIFIKTTQGTYIRLENIDKLWVSTESDEYGRVLRENEPHSAFAVTATMKAGSDYDPYHDLYFSEIEEEAQMWLDSLVKKLNGVAE